MSDLVAAAEKPKQSIDTILREQQPGLEAALAGRIGADRFIRAAVTAFRTTPALQRCTRESILGGLFVAAQLGLEIGGPQAHAHLVPRFNKEIDAFEATLIIGYRGYLELFHRAGARKVEWLIVREGDTLELWSDSERGKQYRHQPLDFDSTRPMVGAIAQVKNQAGDFQWEYMTRAQIEARRPKKWENTPWKAWPEEMALKTVMRQLAKTVRTSTDELALAVKHDDAVIVQQEGGLPVKVDHVPVEAVEDTANEV